MLSPVGITVFTLNSSITERGEPAEVAQAMPRNLTPQACPDLLSLLAALVGVKVIDEI